MVISNFLPLLAVFSVFSAGAGYGQSCASRGPTELAGGVDICVSSVLASQSGNSYGPENLMDGDNRTAWCEGVAGNGEGQEITISIYDGIPFRRLIIQNGYGKSDKVFRNNGRARTIEILTDSGASVRGQLPDHPDDVTVNLPSLAMYEHLVIRILDVYPGTKYRDTCINYISPDLDYERYLEFESQGLN